MDQLEFDRRVRNEIQRFKTGDRTESAAFLMWYLDNFFRLDEEDAISSVCDSGNDKGIDAIYADEDEEEIHLFQSKYSPEYGRSQGDNDLRNFVGAKQWISNGNAEALLQSTASPELKSLVVATGVLDKVASGYPIYSHFVTNKVFDQNAKEFLGINESVMIGHDLQGLLDEYTYFADRDVQTGETPLHLTNPTKIEYNLPSGLNAKVYSIPAKELVTLNGLQDQTLFLRNVRYGLGNTKVNKDLKKTIRDSSEHNRFFFYHNGITLVCDGLSEDGLTITLRNYSVINGCQSMLTLYENKAYITDDMQVLTKVIVVDQTLPIVSDITRYTNSQNPIRVEDLKSDDRVHKAIQTEFTNLLGHRVFYMRKRGEDTTGYSKVIEMDLAAQLIESFYLGHPYNTHLKARLFGDRYAEIFSRHTTAARIFFADLVYEVILENLSKIKNAQARTYGLAHFFFLHMIAEILRDDDLGEVVLTDPTDYVKNHEIELRFATKKVWELLTPDINAYIDEYSVAHAGFFDYKNVFKNADFVSAATLRLKTDNQKALVRHGEDAFKIIYETPQPQEPPPPIS